MIVLSPAVAWAHLATAAIGSAVQTHAPSSPTPAIHPPALTGLIVFGLLAAYFTALCFCYSRRYRAARIGAAAGLACVTACTALQGAWPAAAVLALFTSGTIRFYSYDFVAKKTPRRRRFVHQNRFALSPSSSAPLYWLN